MLGLFVIAFSGFVRYIPAEHRAGIITLFQVPANAISVFVLVNVNNCRFIYEVTTNLLTLRKSNNKRMQCDLFSGQHVPASRKQQDIWSFNCRSFRRRILLTHITPIEITISWYQLSGENITVN